MLEIFVYIYEPHIDVMPLNADCDLAAACRVAIYANLQNTAECPAWGRGTPFTPGPFPSSSFALFYFSLFSML